MADAQVRSLEENCCSRVPVSNVQSELNRALIGRQRDEFACLFSIPCQELLHRFMRDVVALLNFIYLKLRSSLLLLLTMGEFV